MLNFYRYNNTDNKNDMVRYTHEMNVSDMDKVKLVISFAVFMGRCFYQEDVTCAIYDKGTWKQIDVSCDVSPEQLAVQIRQQLENKENDNPDSIIPVLVFDAEVTEELVKSYGMVFAAYIDKNVVELSISSLWENAESGEMYLDYFVQIFKQLSKASRISDIKIFDDKSADEIRKINCTEVTFDENKTLPDLFEQYVISQPDSIALTNSKIRLTYKELDCAANSIAERIVKYSKGEKRNVVILGERGVEYIVAILAVLKAGFTYVPVDNNFPKQRIDSIVEEANPILILATGRTDYVAPVKIIDAADYDTDYEGEICSVGRDAQEPAYIIFTSGTTGRPKGVVLSHRGAVNLAACLKRTFGIQKGKAVLQFANMVFDASVWEMLASIFSGGELVVPENDVIRDIYQMQNFIEEHPVELAVLPPQYYLQLHTESIGSVVTAGAAASAEVIEKAKEHAVRYVNAYGPTEITVHATSWKPDMDDDIRNIYIGKPIDNTQIHIYNRYEECPKGVVGEICVCGAGVAIGYLNRPELTARKFTDSEYGRMYHTGDLGFFSKDGNVVFLGRKDKQIKIRGFRIEKEEIESVMIRTNMVREVSVVYYKKEQEEKLLAFVAADKEVDSAAIKKRIGEYLADYMIPDEIIQVPGLPVTYSGKVDENSLLKIIENRENENKSEKHLFKNETEKAVYEIMCKVLGTNDIDMTKSFLANGGNSLSAIILQNELMNKLGIKLSLINIFKLKTVVNIADYLVEKEDKEPVALPELVPDMENQDKPFPLTDIQKAYYVGAMNEMELSDKSTRAYSRILCADYCKERLAFAVKMIIKNHDVLRTIIYEDGMQRIIPFEEMKLPDIAESDISQLSGGEQNAWLQQHKDDLMNKQNFNPHIPQMIYIEVTKINSNDVYIHFLHDGIVADGFSHELLISEMEQYYLNENFEYESTLSFRDYACYFDNLKKTEFYKECKEYWLKEIESFGEAPQLPLNTDVLERDSLRLENIRRVLSKETLSDISKFSKDMNLSEFAIMFTAFCKAIAKYSASQSFLINVPQVMRPKVNEEIDLLIGECSNFFLFNFQNKRKETVLATAHRIQDKLAEIRDYNVYSGIDIISEYRKYNSNYSGIVTPVVFTELLSCKRQNRNHFIKECTVSHTSQVWMDAVVLREHDETVICLDCVKDLFGENIADRIADTFIDYLENLEKWGRMCGMPNLPEDRAAALACNNPADFPVTLRLHTLLEESFKKYKHNIAITDGFTEYTYAQVERITANIVNAILKTGCSDVAFWLEKSPVQIMLSLGCTLAGVAYMPMDKEYTTEMCREVLEQTGIRTVITENATDIREHWGNVEVICVESLICDAEETETVVNRSDCTYIINTSGTTGTPKSIRIGEEGLVSCLLHTIAYYNITKEDAILAVTNYCHDMSVFDIYGMILAGGKVVVPKGAKDVEEWCSLMETQHVTVWNSVPAIMSMLEMYAEGNPAPFQYLRTAFLGGDHIPVSLVKSMWNHNPETNIVSVGGPSETTLWNISHSITNEDLACDVIPYGKPFPNTQYFVLNDNRELCPVGVTGEMYVSGIGVANGYCGNAALTKEKFIYWKGRRVYRTGDLGMYRKDGVIVITGRNDNQIKRNGKRIELEGIEQIVENVQGIRRCVVVYLDKKDKLAAFYIPKESGMDMESSIRKELEKKLQWYMIPNRYVCCGELPVTKNGKTDRKKIKELAKAICDEKVKTAISEDGIVDIVREVMENPDIKDSDHFYNIGGTSMLAIRILSQIRKKLNLKLNLGKMLESPVIGSWNMLAEKCENHTIENKEKSVPLSFTQEEIFVADQIYVNGRYTMCAYAEFKEWPDEQRLKAALRKVVERNEIMSCCIISQNGTQMLRFSDELCIHEIGYETFENFTDAEIFMREESEKRIDILQKGPYRLKVVCVAGKKWYLLLALHHIIADEQTYALILREIVDEYDGRELPQKSLPYAAYLDWAAKAPADSRLERKILEQKKLELPYKNGIASDQAGMLRFNLPVKDINGLREICARYDTSLFTGMLAIFAATLSQIANTEHICIASPFSDRMEDDYENTAGLFITKVLLMMEVHRNSSLAELIHSAGNAVADAMEQTSGAVCKKLRNEGNYREISQIHNHIVFNFVESAFKDTVRFIKNETDSTTGLHFFIEHTGEDYECNCVYKESFVNRSQAKELCEKWMLNLKWYVRYDLYKNADYKTRAQYVQELIGHNKVMNNHLSTRKEETQYPLSMIQNQMLFAELSSRENRSVLAGYIVIHGNIDRNRMLKAIKRALMFHEAVRYGFDVSNDNPVQYLRKIPLEESKFYSYHELDDDGKIDELLYAFSHKQMNLISDVLYRFMLIKKSDTESILAESFHHIISDEQTFMIFLHDVLSFYEQEDSYNPVKSESYEKFIMDKISIVTENQWWNEQLSRERMEHVLFSDVIHAEDGNISIIDSLPLDDLMVGNFIEICREQKLTDFMGFLSVFMTTLYALSGKEQISLVVPYSERVNGNYLNTCGLFIDKLFVTQEYSTDKTIRELLHQVREYMLSSYQYGPEQMRRSLKESGLEKTFEQMENNIVFNVINSVREQFDGKDITAGELKYLRNQQNSGIHLHFCIEFVDGKYQAAFSYNTKFVAESVIDELKIKFVDVMEFYANHFDETIATLLFAKDNMKETELSGGDFDEFF